jgi:transposase
MGLEDEPWWDDLVKKKDTHSLRDLAEEFGVSAGAISLALKRTNTSKVPQGTEPVAPPSATNRPGSKDYLLEPMIDRLGSVPDAEIAKDAGVSVRTVASYRARNNIKGYTGRSAPTQRRRRKSKIDPYVDLLGKVPDRVVAEKAGVTLNAVRNYRANRGIVSARQQAKEARERAAASASEPASTASETPTPVETTQSTPPTATASAGRYAWRVDFASREGGIVTGSNATDAAARAERLGVVTGLTRLEALLD